MNSERKFLNFKLDLLSQKSFKVVEEKYEENFISILGIKTGFNANKLQAPENKSINSYFQVMVLSALCTLIT